jgi:hypothetical protein
VLLLFLADTFVDGEEVFRPTCFDLNNYTVDVSNGIKLSIQTFDAKGKETNSSAVFYTRLRGPAIVMPSSKHVVNSTYLYVFEPRMTGSYTIDVTLMYDGYDESKWKSVPRPVAVHRSFLLTGCLFSCHGKSSPWVEPMFEEHEYEVCMNLCREWYNAGPVLLDFRHELGPFNYTSIESTSPSLAAELEPVCTSETINSDGNWVNLTVACGSVIEAGCKSKYIACLTNTSDVLCTSELVYKPHGCRLRPWFANSDCPNHKTLNISFLGVSTTHEILHETQSIDSRVYLDAAANVSVIGSCGGMAGAGTSTLPADYGMQDCISELASRTSCIVHTAPASHPYIFKRREHAHADTRAPFHGQRGYLTYLSLETFNSRFFSTLSRCLLLDEYSITYPLRDFQGDALHFRGRNHKDNQFVIHTVATTLLHMLQPLMCF